MGEWTGDWGAGWAFPLSPCLASPMGPAESFPCEACGPSFTERCFPGSDAASGPACAVGCRGQPWPRTQLTRLPPQRPGTWLVLQVAPGRDALQV